MTVLEGLEDSGRPCAEVLSVPGFFAVPGRFLSGKWFILREKREETRLVVPLLSNLRIKSVKHHTVRPTVGTTEGGYVRVCTGRLPT